MDRRGASGLKGSRYVWAPRALVAAVLICPLISPAAPPTLYKLADLKALEKAFVEMADMVQPSVVAIRCYQVRDPADRRAMQARLPISQGSGFVIDAAGYIATNEHVIEDAHVISITLHNGLQYDAQVVQTDVRSDLAVLKINAEGLRPVRLGDSADLKVNQWSFACGNPFGLAFDNRGRSSVTYGVVSALGRQMTHRLSADPQRRYYGHLIETSSAINPGNSGGPLFNLNGEMIGVVVAIETSDLSDRLEITYTSTMLSGRVVVPDDLVAATIGDPETFCTPLRIRRSAQFVERDGKYLSPISRGVVSKTS